MVPLVGQINPHDQEKKYSKRPLCVVYYGVDFSFEYRKGKCIYEIMVNIYAVGLKSVVETSTKNFQLHGRFCRSM